MASGDLTATIIATGALSNADVINTIDGANLAAVTDMLFIVPFGDRDGQIRIIKVEREA